MILKILRVSVYVAGVIIFIVLAVEFTLRGLGYTYSSPHIMHDQSCYSRMAPRQRMYFKDEYGESAVITINSLGARGKEFPIEKSAGEKRIICVGDSYTYGWGVDDAHTYPAYLQNLLNDNISKFKVINFGCNGHTILHETDLIKKYGLKLKPDYIIIAATLHTDFADIDELEYRLGYMPIPGYNFIKYWIRKTAIGNIMLQYWNSGKVKDIINRRKQLQPQALAERINDIPEKVKSKSAFSIYINKLDQLIELGEKNNFHIIYVIMPHCPGGLDKFKISGAYRKDGSITARAYYEFLKYKYEGKITIVELMSYFNSNDLFLSDRHLNAEGNELAARMIYENIKEYLE